MVRKLVVFVGAAMVLGACAKKQMVKPVSEPPAVPVVTDTDREPSLRHKTWAAVPELQTVRFDYDKAVLRADAVEILKKNAEYLKAMPDLEIIVEGHCDERGTVEYNLGLGQGRATIVRDYYGRLGVPLNRIATISYGEEKPVETGRTESAWAKNRRAETKIRSIR